MQACYICYISTSFWISSKWNEDDLIFITKDGQAMFPSSFGHWLKKFTKDNNLPDISNPSLIAYACNICYK
ncbi:MAG: hypothetical protein K0Q53_1537 [Massilibacillus sp.]|nr:hypothetical protein [Massilibacillus sp.]